MVSPVILVLLRCFSLLLLWGLLAPSVCILEPFLSCRMLEMSCSLATSIAFMVSLLIGCFPPSIGVSVSKAFKLY